jgi:hypothetical protein
MAEGWRICEELADGLDHIIPGQDPAVLSRFPPLPGRPDAVRLDLLPAGQAVAGAQ